MKMSGYILILFGFLGGALLAVQDTYIILSWEWFLASLMVGAGGVLAVRLATNRAARSEGVLEANLQNVISSLGDISQSTSQLNQEKDSLNVYDFRHRIDASFPDDLETFTSSREVISHLFGLQAYADVMSEFAAGERYLNRVWSASADGYVDEVNTYVGMAAEQFSAALERLKQLQASQKKR